MRQRLQPTTMSLRSYGGADLNIIGHVRCCLSVGKHKVDTMLQVQPNAPINLLLGTDTLPKLGFTLAYQAGCKDLLEVKTTGRETALDNKRDAADSASEKSTIDLVQPEKELIHTDLQGIPNLFVWD